MHFCKRLQFYNMCGYTNDICSWSKGPLCKSQSAPKINYAAIAVLRLVKHSYLLNLKKFNVIQDINVASIWKTNQLAQMYFLSTDITKLLDSSN